MACACGHTPAARKRTLMPRSTHLSYGGQPESAFAGCVRPRPGHRTARASPGDARRSTDAVRNGLVGHCAGGSPSAAVVSRALPLARAATMVCMFATACASAVTPPPPVRSSVTVDARPGAAVTPFPHFWKRSFGSGHAKLTQRADWQAHLKRAVADLGLAGVRYHGLFDDDMGVVTAPGVYNFTRVIAAWDYQRSLGVTPIVELSFMPAFLANCSWRDPGAPGAAPINPGKPACRHTAMAYRGITAVPAVAADWYDLVRATAQAAVDRYGAAEVRTWAFEVWNELWGVPFPDAYMALYNASARAVKSVDPLLRVGGPATAQLDHAADFVSRAAAAGLPVDFVSTHMYPTDPQCARGARWDPDCLTRHVRAARAAVAAYPFYLTEYNVGCCLGYAQHDTGAAAAFAFRQVGALSGVVDVLSWWTFSDVFEEGGFPGTEFSGVYGLMTYHGVPKPGWRGFQLLNRAGDHRVPVTLREPQLVADPAAAACVTEERTNMLGFTTARRNATDAGACCAACRAATPTDCEFWSWHAPSACELKSSDAGRAVAPAYTSGSRFAPAPPPPTPAGSPLSAFATTNGTAAGLRGLRVFLGLWGNPDFADATRDRVVQVAVAHAADEGPKAVMGHRIDEMHANPRAAWVAMGSPRAPSASQIAALIEASEVRPEAVAFDTAGAVTVVSVHMTPNSAVCLDFD